MARPCWCRARASVHWFCIRMEHVQPPHSTAVRWSAVVVEPAVHHLHDRAGIAGLERCHWRTMGGTSRSAGCRPRRRSLRRQRIAAGGRRTGVPATAARVPGHGCYWRHRLRPRVHRPGQHTGTLVSRSPRHGHRYGHHGLWRRRVHRRISQCVPDCSRGNRHHDHGAWRDLSGDHVRRFDTP